nr:ribbon-helix-helix domain-containing protein [Nitrosomonas nitrosa]
MTSILLRIPESLLADLDQLAEEIYTNRSALIRQSIVRNLDILRHVELPYIREHCRNRLPKMHL